MPARELVEVLAEISARPGLAQHPAIAALREPDCPEIAMGCTLRPGSQVLDLVSGQRGTVIATTIRHALIPVT